MVLDLLGVARGLLRLADARDVELEALGFLLSLRVQELCEGATQGDFLPLAVGGGRLGLGLQQVDCLARLLYKE